MLACRVEFPGSGAQDAEYIMCVGQRAGVTSFLGELQGAAREFLSVAGFPAPMGRQAPIGVGTRPFSRRPMLADRVERRLEMALGLFPLAAAAVDVREFALDTRQRF